MSGDKAEASIWLSRVSGAVFAVVPYLIILAGLLRGDLFPAMNLEGSHGKGVTLFNFLQGVEPKGYTD